MDNGFDLVYFINSQGRRVVLSSPENRNYWELRGRYGFTAADVDIFTEKMASGETMYFGKALKPRECGMRMICRGEDNAERDRLFFEMLSVLLDADGGGEGRLYVKTSAGATAYLNCVYSGGMNIVEQYQKFHLFTISFFAADPRFYVVQRVFVLNDIQPSLTYDNTTGETLAVLINAGYPYNSAWTLTGYVSNTTTGKKLTFDAHSTYPSNELPAGSKLEMFTSPWRKKAEVILANGTRSSATQWLDMSDTDLDFSIVPGTNTIDVSHLNAASANNFVFTFLRKMAGV